MNFKLSGRVSRLAAIGAILFGSASCVTVDETLGENFIPTEHQWDVFAPAAEDLEDICLQMADSLTAYSSTRFTFGAINDGVLGTSVKSTSFTLVPFVDTIDFGKNTRIRQFHFTAVRDTLSVVNDDQLKMLQNVYVSELKQPLDSNVLYAGAFMHPEIRDKYLDPDNRITVGVPVYNGGDSLSFDFSLEFAESFVERLKKTRLDSIDYYIEDLPGIYITTDEPTGKGGRINMFNLKFDRDSYGYLTGNYAELKITAEYEGYDEPVDTSFIFFFGPADFLKEDSESYPTQFAFNASTHESSAQFIEEWEAGNRENLYVEGGSGLKPVIKAEEIKTIAEKLIAEAGIKNPSEVVVNKATIILPYDVDGNYGLLDKYPTILSPTVRLRSSEGNYVSYAGLTDSSVSSENQGNINRSLCLYSPDVSHHVQEIIKLDRNDEDYAETIEKYDIWFLIMFEEVEEIESSSSSNSLYNNLLYNSYYNNMMYDPYGYGYGYGGYGGYGYGGYGGYGSYGYGSNYYNYYMMAMYASMYNSSSTQTETTTMLDKDRYYNAVLQGPGAETGPKPQIKITFSAPKSAE